MLPPRKQNIHVTSHQQAGGITGGVVNVGALELKGKRKPGFWGWIERWAWIAGIIVAIPAIAALFFITKGKGNEKENMNDKISISSFNQSGGITAHTVNVGAPHRVVDADVKSQLNKLMVGRKEITVTAVMGDAEAFQFATGIFNYLKEQGATVEAGVNQAIFDKPVVGQIAEESPKDGRLRIIIGARQ